MIQVRPLGPQIGAEIHGVDVKTLDDAGFADIYRVWLAHNVVVVPGQHKAAGDYPPEEDRIHWRVSIKEK